MEYDLSLLRLEIILLFLPQAQITQSTQINLKVQNLKEQFHRREF